MSTINERIERRAARSREKEKARHRALKRLRDNHDAEYRVLLKEEVAKAKEARNGESTA